MAERADEVVAQILLDQGTLPANGIDAAVRAHREALNAGARISLLKLLADRGQLSPAQVQAVQEELLRRGVYPRIGEYELIEKLGQGGMGEVYKARHPRLNTLVAVKILLPEIARDAAVATRFKREAMLAAKLQDADIIQVLDVQEADGKCFIIMQFVDGQSLEQRLSGGRLGEVEALRVTAETARALAVAHDHGIVHRDVKPSNIMLTRTGRIKLADLGLSKCRDEDSPALTESGVGLGTPHYIAPEQARDTSAADSRADIYSLGATLYHMVTGATPYDGKGPCDIILKHINEPLTDPRRLAPGLSEDTASLILRMMEKDPSKRIGTCRDVAAEADRICMKLRSDGGKTQPFAAPEAPAVAVASPAAEDADKVRRTRRTTVAIILAVGALCGLGVLAWRGDSGGAAPPRPRTLVTLPLAMASQPVVSSTPATTLAPSASPGATPSTTQATAPTVRAPAVAATQPGSPIAGPAYYIAPDGKPGNAGTIDSPWDIVSGLSGKFPVAPGGTVYLRQGAYRYPVRLSHPSNAFVINLAGSDDKPIHIRPWKDERVTIDGSVQVHKDSRNVWLWNLELTVNDPFPEKMPQAPDGSIDWNKIPRPTGGVADFGWKSKLINLVVHGAGVGVGLRSMHEGSFNEAYGCVLYEIGIPASKGMSGMPLNATFKKGSEVLFSDCMVWGYPDTGYASINIGSQAETNACTLDGNIVSAGIIRFYDASGAIGVTNNWLSKCGLYVTGGGPGANRQVRGNVICGGTLVVPKLQSPATANNTLSPVPNTNRVLLRPNKYDPSRANLAVFNWTMSAAVEADVSTFLKEGEAYRLLNPRDFYGPPVQTGACRAGKITVPMSGEFAAFVLVK